jgi:hypothetical protein
LSDDDDKVVDDCVDEYVSASVVEGLGVLVDDVISTVVAVVDGS